MALILLVGVLAHAVWLLEWVSVDQRVAPMICCDLSGAVADIRNADVSGRPMTLSAWNVVNRGAMSWLAFGVGEVVGWSEDGLLWTQVLALGMAQLVLFWALRPVFRAPVCLTAALLLPLVPGVAFFSRQWSPYPIHTLLLLAALGALIRSRSMSRPFWLLVVGLLGWLGGVVSPMLTDNMMFLAAFGLMVLASVGRGLILARGPDGKPVSRWRVLSGSLLAGTVCVLMLRASLREYGYFLQNIRYYVEELGMSEAGSGQPSPAYTELADPFSVLALTAYPRRFWEMELGTLLSVLVCLGGLRLLLRGRTWARAELLGGLLGPLLLLSLVAKKQAFYVYLILPFVPAVAAALLADWRGRWRPVAVAAGLAVLVSLAAGMIQASEPGTELRRYTTESQSRPGTQMVHVPQWQLSTLQMPYPIHLAPLSGGLSDGDSFLEALSDSCDTPRRVVWLGSQVISARGEADLSACWRWRFAVHGRCLDIDHHAQPDRPVPDAIVLESGPGCIQEPHTPWAREWTQVSDRASWQVAAQRKTPEHRCQQLLVHDPSLLESLQQAGL